ncbi:MAG: (2Fe-2S)-binding protein [Nannocystaceae bacterium]|nr:(2Fe-2S)-binding protein [bacterium]
MDRVLCQCMNVTEREIKRVIRAGADSVDAVGERCEAGTGCGSCRGGIDILIEEVKRAQGRRRLPAALLSQLGQLGLFGGGHDS